MTTQELKSRTKNFALRVMRLIENLPVSTSGKVIGNQLLRSATSVGANYRSACRSRSSVEFISKIRIVEEEADESMYWIELLLESKLSDRVNAINLLSEENELTAIFTSIGKTSKRNLNNQKRLKRKLNNANANCASLNPKSDIPSPKSEIPRPKSEIPNPKSKDA